MQVLHEVTSERSCLQDVSLSCSHSVSILSSYIVILESNSVFYTWVNLAHCLTCHDNLYLSYSVSTDPWKSQHLTATSQSDGVVDFT